MRVSRRRSVVDVEPVGSFRDLLAQAKQGDEMAQAGLYLDHVAMVCGYLRACGVDDSDDVTSDVFLGMLRGLHRFEGNHQDFRRWLMTIAHRRLVDHQRRRCRDRSEPAEPTVLDGWSGGVVATELRPVAIDGDLVAAFGRLTEAQREVLALRFLSDVSLREVSEIVGRPVAAVKSLQNRALASLRRQIGPGGAGGDGMVLR
jgi:RNA polymerase sigma-70 factor (ECF subfamily)